MLDCDVHNTVPGYEALLQYLDGHWREVLTQTAFQGPEDSAYLPVTPVATSVDDVRRDVLDRGVELAVLTCAYAADSIHHPYAAAAMAHAVNDWQVAEWLEPEPRLRASVVVPGAQPELAAEEIDRVGSHPGFVQVFLPIRTALPLGTRHFLPIFEAAVRNDLAVCLHFGGAPGNPPTGAGWPSHYLEEVAGMAQVFQTQLMSMIVEGLFERLPDLRVVLAESGFAWLPAFLWRFDKEWKGLRREIPWTKRPPSEYVADQVRVTLQPVDCPADRLEDVLARLPAEDLLLPASDYPHEHDPPPAGLALDDNARRFYRWL
jgi:predicted TIM-barrel fold metal-dependent hydrolase